jgi:hypothetical protein
LHTGVVHLMEAVDSSACSAVHLAFIKPRPGALPRLFTRIVDGRRQINTTIHATPVPQRMAGSSPAMTIVGPWPPVSGYYALVMPPSMVMVWPVM